MYKGRWCKKCILVNQIFILDIKDFHMMVLIRVLRHLLTTAACQCGAPEQTAQHILSECPDLRPPDNVDLTHPTPGTVTWLEHLRDVT